MLYHVSKWALRARRRYTGPRLPWASRLDKGVTAHAQTHAASKLPSIHPAHDGAAGPQLRSRQDVDAARHNATHTALLKGHCYCRTGARLGCACLPVTQHLRWQRAVAIPSQPHATIYATRCMHAPGQGARSAGRLCGVVHAAKLARFRACHRSSLPTYRAMPHSLGAFAKAHCIHAYSAWRARAQLLRETARAMGL